MDLLRAREEGGSGLKGRLSCPGEVDLLSIIASNACEIMRGNHLPAIPLSLSLSSERMCLMEEPGRWGRRETDAGVEAQGVCSALQVLRGHLKLTK